MAIRHVKNRLELAVLKSLRSSGVKDTSLLLACSGGLDSVVLLQVLSNLKEKLNLELHIAFVHHGNAPKASKKYRDSARKFVRAMAEKLSLPFHTNKELPTNLKSEGDLREYRYHFFNSTMQIHQIKYLALAHHQDDLLETRVLRLIRGVGPEGLTSMVEKNGLKIRPLLNFSRTELGEYAKLKKLKWMDDPSNQDLEPLRNWVRHKWLPALEAKRPGAKRALGQSLGLLAQRAKGQLAWVEKYMGPGGIERSSLLELSKDQQDQIIATYLKRAGVQNYSSSQIREVLKRLRTPRKKFMFKVMKRHWIVSESYLSLAKEEIS